MLEASIIIEHRNIFHEKFHQPSKSFATYSGWLSDPLKG